MKKIINKQYAKGKKAVNIGGDAVGCDFGDHCLTQKSKSNQVQTIMKLIVLITKISEENQTQDYSRDSEKDIEKKLKDRFREYQDELKRSYSESLTIYGDSYKEAKENSDIADNQYNKINNFLEDKSKEYLEKNNNNPIKALNELSSFFEKELNQSEDNYDSPAIKFFLFQQLIECSVFPNPLNL